MTIPMTPYLEISMDPLTGNGDIPAMGFGVYRMEPSDVLRMVPHVLLLGYRHIDTAQIYGNEAEVGEGLDRELRTRRVP